MKIKACNIKEYLANTPQITFEVTERCNLSCVYCGYGKLYINKGERINRTLDIDQAIAFLNFIKNLWDEGYLTSTDRVLNISFYGGEPLMNFELIQAVIKYIETNLSAYSLTFVYSMTTNALFLPKYIDYLVSKKFKLLISLDGDEIGSSLRCYKNGNPAFKDIKAAIDEVKTRYAAYFQSNVEFNSVLNNRTSVKEIINYIQDQYGKTPSISEINTDGIDPQMKAEFNAIYADKWASMMELDRDNESKKDFIENPHFERIARYILGHSPYVYQNYNELLFNSQSKRKTIPTGTCLPFSKRVFITVTGNIMPCEKIGYNYAVGKVCGQRISLDFEEIANKYNRYYELASTQCVHCKERNACLSCIFYTGILDKTVKSRCKYFVTEENAKATLLEVYDFLSRYPRAYHYIMTKCEIH